MPKYIPYLVPSRMGDTEVKTNDRVHPAPQQSEESFSEFLQYWVHWQGYGLLYGVPYSLAASEGCFLATHYGLCST